MLPMALAMVAGIAASHLLSTLPTTLWFILLAAAILVGGLTMVLSKSKRTTIPTLALILTFLSLGALRCRQEDPLHDSHHWTHLINTPSHLTLRLKETPIPRERSWKATAEVESIDGQTSRGTLRLYLKKDSLAATLRYGDLLLIHGYADTVHHNLYTTADHYLIIDRDSTSLRARAERLRINLLHRMQDGPMDRRYAGIAEALTLGWRGDLEGNLRAQFRNAGILHLLCVSGLHVGLLAALVGGMLFFVSKDRRGRIIRGSVQLAIIWLFALITGLAPATVRAALMFSLFIFSYMMGRRTDSFNLLAAAAIIMLTATPLLLFDVGWQLSFSSVAGILLARPAIRLQHNFLWTSIIVCTSATLATLPVTLATFHQFHPYFLIANVIIIPLAAFLLVLSLLYMFLPCTITAWLAEWMLKGCDWLTDGISRLPGATFEEIHLSPLFLLLLTAGIIIMFLTINNFISRYQHTKDTPVASSAIGESEQERIVNSK